MSDRLWMAEIKDRVAAFYGVDVLEIMSDRRRATVVWPRHVAMYLCRRHTAHSLEGIGRAFGNRDHTSVRYALRRVEGRMSLSAPAAREVETLSAEIEARNNGVRPTQHDVDMAGRRRDLLAALLRCYRRRLDREGQQLKDRTRALGHLEAMAERAFLTRQPVVDNTLEGSQ